MDEDLAQIRGSSRLVDSLSKILLGTGILGLVVFMDRIQT